MMVFNQAEIRSPAHVIGGLRAAAGGRSILINFQSSLAMNRNRTRWISPVLGLALATFRAHAQFYGFSALVECTADGPVVVITQSGDSPNTCTPAGPVITVAGDRIDFVLDSRIPPDTVCGDTVTFWCRSGVTATLTAGDYHL